MKEEWRDIPGYEGYYQVSDMGRVRGVERRDSLGRTWPARIMKRVNAKGGYFRVELSKKGKPRKWGIHQLVAMAFIGPIPEGHTVNHKDGNKIDNRPHNLEYMTREENAYHSIEVLGNLRRGEESAGVILSNNAVLEMRRIRAEEGLSYKEIGSMFGVKLTTAWAAVNGQNWDWLK